jgi:p-hydroxybenzoate 3-monooxygenase
VAIVGAGPAGLTLSHLLAASGIDCVVLEDCTRDHIEHRVRAGVLEHPTVELFRQLGLAGRLDAEAMFHHGVELAFAGRRHRLDFRELTGRSIAVYGQQEVVKDLVAARLAAGGPLLFEVSDVEPLDLDTDRPRVRFRHQGRSQELRCDIVAGCDGFHGVCRPAVDPAALQVADRVYPFAWLGILARAAPSQHELIYSSHERGFALYSMRSEEITRLYLQVPPDDALEDWSDDRIWSELATRLPTEQGFELRTGPIIERGITAMRSFVASPMRHGRLFLAGDAAHIVPPTGAKGMNLAVADVSVLARAVERFLTTGRQDLLDRYSDTCLRRVWRVQHFSSWMTSMLHRFDDGDPFTRGLQLSELDYVTGSRAASTALAENYVGLPFGELYRTEQR